MAEDYERIEGIEVGQYVGYRFFAVDPAWRRQAVFRRLLETVMASAKAAPDVCGVRLYVEQENHTAQMVYQRLGLSASGYKVYERDFVLSPGSTPGHSS